MLDQPLTPLVALLLEDDAPDAELIALRLDEASGAAGARAVHLLHRASVREGVALLLDTRVDAIILDLTLPDARGLEGLHRVRAASASTPVIVLTGLADQRMAMDALRAGAQDYVVKPPPDGSSLARALEYACERQRLLQRLDASLRATATAERQWRLLAEISETLALFRHLGSALEGVARRMVPDVADCFLLHIGSKRNLPAKTRPSYLNGDCGRPLREGLRRLLRTHGPESLSGPSGRTKLQSLFEAHGFAATTVAPVHLGRTVRGFLVLASKAPRADGVTSAALGRAVADRIDIALAHARLLRRAERAVAARDRAVSIVSHDLRSPLNTIQICATALLDPEPAPPSGIRHMAELISQSAAWAQQIVEDLLDRASLDAGRLSLHRQPTDAAEVIGAAQLMFARTAQEAAIELVRQQDVAPLPLVDADPHRLLQALSNLISNALKFTPPGGRVELAVQAIYSEAGVGASRVSRATGVRFLVADTGHGIPSEDLPHVFDWFWHSPRDARTGVGLGLAITKGIVEAHRGHLRVESALGRGSTFSFTVPLANGRAPTHEHGTAIA
jgi:signal transduction histidine kinase/DNA-binding NarL/FixJ family response regulator